MENVTIFFCYAREDEWLLQGIEKQLSVLKRQGLINTWYDRNISAGSEWMGVIDYHLDTAQIILLLVSPDFVYSDYCYGVEMQRAMQRHERGEALVIPVILRPIHWQSAPFGHLQALPKDAKPVIGPDWHTLDEAFFSVAEGIRALVENLNLQNTPVSSVLMPQLAQNYQGTVHTVNSFLMPQLARNYQGIAHNLTGDMQAPIALRQIVQAQGEIRGFFLWSLPLMGSGPLVGTVNPDGTIYFVVTAADGSTPLTGSKWVQFNGLVAADRSLSGRYDVDNGQVGVWRVGPLL